MVLTITDRAMVLAVERCDTSLKTRGTNGIYRNTSRLSFSECPDSEGLQTYTKWMLEGDVLPPFQSLPDRTRGASSDSRAWMALSQRNPDSNGGLAFCEVPLRLTGRNNEFKLVPCRVYDCDLELT